ncbi:MAG: aminoglycoside phosphotransferase family protein [Pseudobdellovibrionaceae bacterium]
MTANSLEQYVSKWKLSDPQLLTKTFTSDVYKVKHEGDFAVLKILNEKGQEFEARGALVLKCFNGNGSARLIDFDQGAHLMEFIDGPTLKGLVIEKKDDEAIEIISEVISKIHSYSGPIPNELISMRENFRKLFYKIQSGTADSLYIAGANMANKLLESEKEKLVLHGDIHHENILKSTKRGWLCIDPQCLFGERTYEVANTFYNPNGLSEFAESIETIQRRADIFSRNLKMDRQRILEYAFAYGCLSATWCIEDGQDSKPTLRIARKIYSLLR